MAFITVDQRFHVLKDIELYPYNPITQPGDVKRWLFLPNRTDQNPFVPLPQRPPFVPEDKVTIQLCFEVRPSAETSPRFFEATLKDAPSRLGLPLSRQVIVEAYDPLSWDICRTERSQNSFLHTIACYRKLQHLQGKLIPQYYGSFIMMATYDLGLEQKTREIPVVLRESIEGYYLDDVLPEQLTSEQRQDIMEKVINAERKIDKNGVTLVSMQPDQFLLVRQGQGFKIVEWLFAFTSLDPTAISIWACPGLLPSALLRWKKEFLEGYGFDRFVDWPWAPWLYEKYGHELKSIKERQIKLIWGLDEYIEQKRQEAKRTKGAKRRKDQDGGRVDKKKQVGSVKGKRTPIRTRSGK
ncbi:hypothetical protein TRVA0_039S00694 [Trichomonascus vanleenenianus]|uniref:uncharacterized protein n=1 Tax=Trichomonascus vanleenenianus TaxID=2268995 RepID=UPI003ECBA2D3